MRDRVHARYWIETAYPLDYAAQVMAGEQSTGTFVRVAGETDELRAAHAARVEEIKELGSVRAPSLPAQVKPMQRRQQAEVELRGHWRISVRRCQIYWRQWPATCLSSSRFPVLSCSISSCRSRSTTAIRGRSSGQRARAD